jgi:FHA domain
VDIPSEKGSPIDYLRRKRIVPAFLKWQVGSGSWRSRTLTEPLTTIGRWPGNTIVLSDPTLSRKHFAIRQLEGTYSLELLQPRSGTYVDGVPVTIPQPLGSTHRIRAGRVVLLFVIQAEQQHSTEISDPGLNNTWAPCPLKPASMELTPMYGWRLRFCWQLTWTRCAIDLGWQSTAPRNAGDS